MKANELARSRRKPLRGRASGRSYENTPEKIRAIKEKYKNGVPAGEVDRRYSRRRRKGKAYPLP